jgi:hypothetical protein
LPKANELKAQARIQDRLTARQARRIALAAQGFADPLPRATPGRPHLKRVFDRVGLIQIDSVNVLARSHYLPLFARLGSYPMKLLEDAAWGRRKILFEYWGHEAALLPVGRQPLMRWRMADARAGKGLWRGVKTFADENKAFIKRTLDEIEKRGPLSAGDLSEGGRGKGSWWGWSDSKRALEGLFWMGYVTTATRRGGFERVYDLTERVLPQGVIDAPTPSPAEAQRELIRIAMRSMGVATARDLRDYFRMPVEGFETRVRELVEAGDLIPVEVKDWGRPAFLDPHAKRPRPIERATLLSPFDSLVWRRERAERLFDFHYRLEIYTPEHKRVHGYYVLPFLMDEALSGRVDLKADRENKRLLVKAAHVQDSHTPGEVAERLAPELKRMAGWLGLDEVRVEGKQALAKALKPLV